MATDVDVQFFSHLNGLVLGNNWGDLIRLLDKTLVTGINFTQITAASIDAQGDVHITLYAAHNAMLFQVVELTGFMPASLNQKYRIKGVPNTTQLILKPKTDIAEPAITTIGIGKLAPLGYDIVFRDSNDVKRVYRAKNPTAQHPFIRIDETISDGVNSYNSNYAKSAMVGLIENMTHIDDYLDPNKLQLPLDTTDFSKNWKIKGTGSGIVRGWSKWYYACAVEPWVDIFETAQPVNTTKHFTLLGDADCFYMLRNLANITEYGKLLAGCGLFNANYDTALEKNWFLMTSLSNKTAGTYLGLGAVDCGVPLANSSGAVYSGFFTPQKVNENHMITTPIVPDFSSGYSNFANLTNTPALEIPIITVSKKLKGGLKHIYYSGKNTGITQPTPVISNNSMYLNDTLYVTQNSGQRGNAYFYLGEIE